jgi:hypothetical protein
MTTINREEDSIWFNQLLNLLESWRFDWAGELDSKEIFKALTLKTLKLKSSHRIMNVCEVAAGLSTLDLESVRIISFAFRSKYSQIANIEKLLLNVEKNESKRMK